MDRELGEFVVVDELVSKEHLLRKIDAATEEVSLNAAYRWFPDCAPREETPHFSAVSDNFRHWITEETVDQVFAWSLSEVAEAGICLPRPFLLTARTSQRDEP